MGWGNCGTDSEDRPIGYNFEAICDHPECNKEIDRGLSYACGDMHGTTEAGCEKYFCEDHRNNYVRITEDEADVELICDQCASDLLSTGEWREDEMEAQIVRA